MKDISRSPSPVHPVLGNISPVEEHHSSSRLVPMESSEPSGSHKRTAHAALENPPGSAIQIALRKKAKRATESGAPGHSQISMSSASTVGAPGLTPVVKELANEQVPDLIASMMAAIKQYAKEENPSVDPERLRDTYSTLKNFETDLARNVNRTAYCCEEGGHPKGFLILENGGNYPPYIVNMVTHPGKRGLGKKLIEHAVNCSREGGRGGVVEIAAGSEKAREIYESLGFKKNGDRFLELNPSTATSTWELGADGKWALKSNA